METIIKNIPATTPVAVLNLGNNTLTKLPANLPQYTQLQTLIASSNGITAVNENEAALTADVTNLDFSNNQISLIALAALPGKKILICVTLFM